MKLHCILFNVDDYDANGAIPGRYANITRTAECLRYMAHCSGGRFHWIRETGNSQKLFHMRHFLQLKSTHTFLIFLYENLCSVSLKKVPHI